MDFTGQLKAEEFLKAKISECTVKGKLVAIPWDSGPCALYTHRTDYFKKAGVKATLTELQKSALEKIKQ